jgi:hypothetical protein
MPYYRGKGYELEWWIVLVAALFAAKAGASTMSRPADNSPVEL